MTQITDFIARSVEMADGIWRLLKNQRTGSQPNMRTTVIEHTPSLSNSRFTDSTEGRALKSNSPLRTHEKEVKLTIDTDHPNLELGK